MSGMIHSALQFLEGLGYWGIFIGLMLEVIPNELLLAYAGYLVSKGEINPYGAVVCAVIGGTLAQIVLYWIGRYGGRPFLERYGKYLLINKHHIDVAENWFNKYGPGMIFTARFIPIVRHAISIPGGMARMSLARFTVYTAVALIPYSILYIWLGRTLGAKWETIDQVARPYVKPVVIAAIVLTVAYIIYKIVRKPRPAAHGDEGERSTAHQLRYLGREYRVLNNRQVRAGGGSQQFDHLVVGPNGVFHIDSKHWSGEIRFTEQGVGRSKEGSHQGDPTAQLYRHEHVMKELLRAGGMQADIVGVLCFTHPHSELIGRSPAFLTVKLDRLLHTIKTYKPKKPLSSQQVAGIERLIKEHSSVPH